MASSASPASDVHASRSAVATSVAPTTRVVTVVVPPSVRAAASRARSGSVKSSSTMPRWRPSTTTSPAPTAAAAARMPPARDPTGVWTAATGQPSVSSISLASAVATHTAIPSSTPGAPPIADAGYQTWTRCKAAPDSRARCATAFRAVQLADVPSVAKRIVAPQRRCPAPLRSPCMAGARRSAGEGRPASERSRFEPPADGRGLSHGVPSASEACPRVRSAPAARGSPAALAPAAGVCGARAAADDGAFAAAQRRC